MSDSSSNLPLISQICHQMPTSLDYTRPHGSYNKTNILSSPHSLLSLSPTHPLSLSPIHPLSLSLTHPSPLSLTHPSIPSLSRSFSLSPTHPLSLSLPHPSPLSLSITHPSPLSLFLPLSVIPSSVLRSQYGDVVFVLLRVAQNRGLIP